MKTYYGKEKVRCHLCGTYLYDTKKNKTYAYSIYKDSDGEHRAHPKCVKKDA